MNREPAPSQPAHQSHTQGTSERVSGDAETMADDDGAPAARAPADILATTPAGGWEGAIRELVRALAAAVLGYPSAAAVDPDLPFTDLGFGSMAAVDLYARLVEATGLPLSLTLAFDHPTPAAVARYLVAEVGGPVGDEAAPAAAPVGPDGEVD